MDIKTGLAFIGVAITVLAPLSYIRDIIRGKTKPHIITWLIWSILVGLAFAVQVAGGGGIGSLVLGFTALMNLVILGFSLRLSRDLVTRFDIVVLMLALLTLVPWHITDDPLISIIFITIIQTVGFIPTYKKSFNSPRQETLSLYTLSAVKQAIGIMALSTYNVLTLLFPFAVLCANIGLVAVILNRKRHV